jgi:hypothetical protein
MTVLGVSSFQVVIAAGFRRSAGDAWKLAFDQVVVDRDLAEGRIRLYGYSRIVDRSDDQHTLEPRRTVKVRCTI